MNLVAAEGLRPDVDEAYWGRCPDCTETDPENMYCNVGRGHWMYCNKHRTCWFIGANLMSSWRDETEDDWRRNWERIADYRELTLDDVLYSPANISDDCALLELYAWKRKSQ